jgi:beta-mannosidase
VTVAAAGSVVDLGGAWMFGVSDRRIDLGDDPLTALDRAGIALMPAIVPGNLELDLERNGLIGDPFQGMNIVGLRRFERSFVYYHRTFEAPERGLASPALVFGGLDCDARIVLNGMCVGETRNMLIEQVFAVDEAMRDGRRNDLVVEFSPVVGRDQQAEGGHPPGLLAEGGGYAALRVRKAPHMFGWDIMPRALSAGIWRAVELRYRPAEGFETVWLDTESLADDGATATLDLHYSLRIDLDPNDALEVALIARCGDAIIEQRSAVLASAGHMRFSVERPIVWWPRGRGRPDLYDAVVELRRNGQPIDSRQFRHGIRTVALDRTSTADAARSGEFRFIVNGEPVFILGTNWVPLDAYHSRDLERLPAALALVEELGCNLIRCWGGNVYEHDAFFDWCDSHGVLVWQDFAMACAIYPQDPAFQDVVADEVRSVVRRLRQHPSILVWAGDNECDEQYVYKARRRDPNVNVLTRSVIPGVLRLEDPSRPYLPSSPYVDGVAYESGARSLLEDHLWGPRDYYKAPYYQGAAARFASEIGYHGCPDAGSLHRYLSPDSVWPYGGNAEWLLHATSPFPGIDTHDYRLELMASQVRLLFGAIPPTLEDFVAASQASQAEALKFFIELFRSGKWRRTGIIWWNLIDGWPQTSDAVVDYYFAKKQAFETVRRTQAPVLLILREPVDGWQELVVCNDGRADVAVEFELGDLDTGGTLLAGASTAAGDLVVSLGAIRVPERQTVVTLSWQTDAFGSQRSHYLAGTPPFDLNQYRSWMARAYPDEPKRAP